MSHRRSSRWITWSIFSILMIAALVQPAHPPTALASHTPNPSNVTIAGDLQSVAGCAGNWQADCAATHLLYDANDDVWQATFALTAGSYQYKATLNDAWTENYGLHAAAGGANIPLVLPTGTSVKFYYDHKSHWITDNENAVIVTAPGNFQAQLGCSGDWDPSCLRSWLQDSDGDGVYTFETTALTQGNYQAKATIDEGWTENYGQGGVPGGPNIAFFVPTDHANVRFRYTAATHILTITAGHTQDNNVEWEGVRHDSRDLLYRTPGGAVPAGTPVTLRLRTFHNDVTAVKLRVYDINSGGQRFYPMTAAATDVACYQADIADQTCDFWSVTLTMSDPNNLWYRFIITDGSDTDYYADNTSALDGGLGSATEDVVDRGYALMFYDPTFVGPAWARDAVIYQIFPDRFRNGNRANDPRTDDLRYDDPIVALPWDALPEGYCRNYADAASNCPWRFDPTPPDWSLTKEAPRGRDYMGGDLRGVIEKLDYIKNLGVTAIYFNPIFYAKSNHRYDTADYKTIDPYLGDIKDFRKLVSEAKKRGIRIILDGVYNHMSSDSPRFDRYHHYPMTGACESATSPTRGWFDFRAPTGNEPASCAPSTVGGNDTYYDGWFGFDSIPVIKKSNPLVQRYFISDTTSVSRYWLDQGAASWRLDVMGDASFPNGYWEAFRQVVKEEDPDALIIGELWQKDSTLLRFLRGDRADTTMNYRLRDAVIGLLTPSNFDSKGFGDSGRPITPSEFAARIQSVREDYPDAAYYTLMNLLDSHDTERLRWTLTPGTETRADKEQNPTNVADGKRRMNLATLIQFTMPGAPTVYYGDEVGMTGDDDPDDRRTFPWPDTGGTFDTAMLIHYRALAQARRTTAALTAGDLRMLLADDATNTIAYGRKTNRQAAIVAINRSNAPHMIDIPVAGYLPNGLKLRRVYGVGNTSTASKPEVVGGMLRVSLEPMSGLLLATGATDLLPPSAPVNLNIVNEGDTQIALAWNGVAGATSYNIYRSPVSAGGWVKINTTPVLTTNYTDTGLRNATPAFYIVRALDATGNESAASNQVQALPHHTIGWANLQWPPTLNHTISTTNHTGNIYGQIWINGVTQQPGATASLIAQLGVGPHGSDPTGNPQWTWIDAAFNADAGSNDEFVASLLPDQIGTYDYAYRYSTTNGRDWLYADLDSADNGYSPAQAGVLTVIASGDTTAPAIPAGLHVIAASPSGVELGWDALLGDPSLYGYEVRRSDSSGGPYTTIALVAGTTGYTDTNVAEGATYFYTIRAVDAAFNRSAETAPVQATAQLRTVTLIVNLTVPASTDATGRSVYIAGFLDRLDGGLPQWNPGGVSLTRVDSTHWTITLTGRETTQIEYKYALGAWDYVEKDDSCAEVSNRQLTLSYGGTGTQIVNDMVTNWRNVAPCGN